MRDVVGIDFFDRTLLKHPGYIGRNHIPDTAVTGTFDIAALDNVPDCNAIFQKKLLFFFHRYRNSFFPYACQHLPETVHGMSIEKLLFPGFHGWETSQNQYTGIPIVNRGKGMCYMTIFHVSKFHISIFSAFPRFPFLSFVFLHFVISIIPQPSVNFPRYYASLHLRSVLR